METTSTCAVRRGRGRPLAFDREQALQQATRLFWERGYEGTSFDQLITAMGISASSFYGSFGSKERLYAEAAGAFIAASRSWFEVILNAPTGTRSAFEHLLSATAERFTTRDQPAGCMISLAGTHLPPALGSVREMMVTHRAAAQAALTARLRLGITAGDLPADTDIEALSAFYSAVFRGMAVQARDGVSRACLLEIGKVAMRAWPERARP